MTPTKDKYYDRFRERIEEVINVFSLEDGSDTPDYVLSAYLVDCLKAYDRALQRRDKHYGHDVDSKPKDPSIVHPDEFNRCIRNDPNDTGWER